MSESRMTGRNPQRTGRRPRIHRRGRVCVEGDCPTVLSRYNPADRCYLHAPTRYPRVRGALRAPGKAPEAGSPS